MSSNKSSTPKHPARNRALVFLVVGAVYVCIGALLWVGGGGSASLLMAGLGVLLGLLGFRLGATATATSSLNLSYQHITRGELSKASALLDELENQRPARLFRRISSLQRARIALARGALDEAQRHLDACIAMPPTRFSKTQENVHIAGAFAWRAFVRAATGNPTGALEDARSAEKNTSSTPDSLAVATLAQAIVLEKKGDTAALRAHIDTHKRLLFDHTLPYDRAIVRALVRMVRAEKASIYRTAPRPSEVPSQEQPPVATWLERVLPEAAGFAPKRPSPPTTSSPAPVAAPTGDASKMRVGLEALARPERNRYALRFVLVFLAVAGGIGAYVFLGPSDAPGSPHATGPTSFFAPLFAALLVAIGIRVLRQRKALAAFRQTLDATARLARDDQTAIHDLERLASGGSQVIRASALLALAAERERSADFEGALPIVEKGLGIAQSVKLLAHDMLLPGLLAERALLQIGLDKPDQARGTMAHLSAGFPNYAFAARARFRYELALRARAGDLAGAAQVALGRGADLAVALRDELLGDIAIAVASPRTLGATEIERLREELASDEGTRRWIQRMAPGLIDAFERPEMLNEAETEEEARVEVEAEEEARSAAAPRLRA